MTKYIIKYQNGKLIVLSGEEAEKEYKGNWETNVEIKHKNEENEDSEKSGNKGNDSLVSVFTMPILGMLRTMFIPFLSVEYNSEEKKEE